MSDPTRWICVVDQTHGRLLATTAAPAGRHRLEVRHEIENEYEEHQRTRPSPLLGKDKRAYASRGHEDEERLQRFAGDVAEWLEQQTRKRHIEHVDVFASVDLLGELRKSWPPPLKGKLTEHSTNLGNLDAGQLVEHSEVLAILERD